MSLEVEVRNEIEKLSTLRYEEVNGEYKAVLRNPQSDPDIDQVVDNIKTIYAKYLLEHGV